MLKIIYAGIIGLGLPNGTILAALHRSRQLTEILRRGKRTLCKSLTRSQSEDEKSISSVAHSLSLESTSTLDKVTTIIIMITIINVSISLQPPAGATANNPSQQTPKEKVQQSIQARGFTSCKQ